MRLNSGVLLAVGVSALMPDYYTYYQNNQVLRDLVGYFEGNLSAANDVVNLPITHLQMANQIQPYQINMDATVWAIRSIYAERNSAWKLSIFHMAQREKLLVKYFKERDEIKKTAYQRLIGESNRNLTEIFAMAGLRRNDMALAYNAHYSFFALQDVNGNLGALWINKRNRAARVQSLINYLKIY